MIIASSLVAFYSLIGEITGTVRLTEEINVWVAQVQFLNCTCAVLSRSTTQ